MKQVQKNYENELRKNEDVQFGEPKELLSRPIRPSLEIEQEIINIDSELDNLSFPANFNKENIPSNIPVIIEMFKEFDTILSDNYEKINISATEEEIEEIFSYF